jgi:hypothetical protein
MGCLLPKPPPPVVAQPYDPSEPLRPDLPAEAEMLSDAIRRATGVPKPSPDHYICVFGAINADRQSVVRYAIWTGSPQNPPPEIRALISLGVRHAILFDRDRLARDIGPV